MKNKKRTEKGLDKTHMPTYFIKCCAPISMVCTFILQFYLNTLLMNKVGECYLQSIVRIEYFSFIFREKKCALYSIKYGV
jgi:hypothetical protein